MSQLLAGAGPYTIVKSWEIDGTPDAGVNTVTIGIVDGNGDTIISAGTATTDNNDGTYDYVLADQPLPDQLTVTWTRTDTSADLIDRIELVGNWLFIESQARGFQAKADATSALKPLNSATEYPDAILAAERLRIQDDLESWTGRSWVPRYCRVELNGNGSRILPLGGIARTSDGYALNRSGRWADIAVILTVTINGTLQTASDYTFDPIGSNIVSKVGPFRVGTVSTPYNVVVEYVYGLPTIVDGVDRIAMKLLVDRLVPSSFPDRALSVDTDFGTTRFVQPGGPMNNVSRVPEVNEWVRSHYNRLPIS